MKSLKYSSHRNGKLPLATLVLVLSPVALLAQPVINSIHPPALTQGVGSHLAYAVSASGSGTLTYQWYFAPSGQASAPLAGQTNSALVLTNIQTTNTGVYSVTVVDGSGLSASNWAALNVSGAGYLPLYSTNLVVARIGEGAQALSHATGNTIYLDQYTPGGAYVNTVMVPDENVGAAYGTGSSKSTYGSPSLLVDGAGTDCPNEAMLTLSLNQQFLAVAGYCKDYPFSGTDVTSSSGVGGNKWPGIATINVFGQYMLAYTNSGLYSGGLHTIHSAVTSDGVTNFWSTGQAGSGGVKYLDSTATSVMTGNGIPAVSTASGTGTRVVQIVNGNLVYSDWLGASGSGLYACTGIPILAPLGSTNSALLLLEGGQPDDFAFSPDGLTVYIADSGTFGGNNVQGGGVQRWDTSTPFANYTYSYTLAPNAGTSGALGLVVDFSAQTSWGQGVLGAVLFTTSADTNANTLSRIVDNGPSSTATVLVTASAKQLLRGVRFGPIAAPVFIAVQPPATQTNAMGATVTLSVKAGGSTPFYYQWRFDGTNVAGQTKATLSLTNVQLANAGSYDVVVSNPGSSVTSSVTALSVTLGPPVITSLPHAVVETEGDHFALAVGATGTLPMSYQWSKGATPISGATTSALVFTNAQTSNSGSYSVSITNTFGQTNLTGIAVTVTAALQPVSSNNLVVVRIGDGVQTLSGVTGNTVYLDQYTPGGTYINTIQVPDEGTGWPYGYGSTRSADLPFGSQALILPGTGDAAYEGFLTLSADQASLNFIGYLQAYPYGSSDVTYSFGNGGANWRAIGSLGLNGYYSVVWTNTGLYSLAGHSARSAVSSDQTHYWTAGLAGNSGIKVLDAAFQPASGIGLVDLPAGSNGLKSSGSGCRVVQIINGDLVFSDAGGTPPGLYVCAGAVSPATLLLQETNSPTDFSISPDRATVYVADDGSFTGTSVPGGGIQRWDADPVNGGYAYSYTLGTGTGPAVGARGLTVQFPSNISTWGKGINGATLWATTAETSGNRLIKMVDNGAASPATTVVAAPTSQILSGVRFGPSTLAPVTIASDLQNLSAFVGQSVTLSIGVVGTGPFFYQWQSNGTNIAGATNGSLILSDVQFASAGNYSVNVSNEVSAVSSSIAQLTINPLPSFAPSTYLGPGTGFQLNFTGPAGYTFSIWTSTNLALKPVTKTWTHLVNGYYFSGGQDWFIDPNGGTNQQQYYIITVP